MSNNVKTKKLGDLTLTEVVDILTNTAETYPFNRAGIMIYALRDAIKKHIGESK